jgi:hypothetical protein
MPLEIKRSVQQMFEAAMAEIETWSVDQARQALGEPDVTFIDLRDPRELWREGGIPGAINVTRGMLEMWIDPGSPYAKTYFQTGNRFVLFCGGGCVLRWRRRPPRTWDSRRCVTSRGASARGRRLAPRWRPSSQSPGRSPSGARIARRVRASPLLSRSPPSRRQR